MHACDAPLYGLLEDIAALQDLREAGELPLRVISYHDAFPNLNFRSFLGDDHICYGGLKIFLDGSLGGHSAALREGYSDQPSVRGQLCHSDRELMEMLAEAQARKIQVQMHMIGDASIDQAIRVSKELLERTGKAPAYPLRFNHVIVSHPEQLDAMKSLGVVVDLQPIQAFTDREMAPERLGKKRMEGTYPFRRLYDAGLLVTGSSDAPIEHPNPWLGIWAAVCGTDEIMRPSTIILIPPIMPSSILLSRLTFLPSSLDISFSNLEIWLFVSSLTECISPLVTPLSRSAVRLNSRIML